MEAFNFPYNLDGQHATDCVYNVNAVASAVGCKNKCDV